jgi:hypothetical protein
MTGLDSVQCTSASTYIHFWGNGDVGLANLSSQVLPSNWGL